MCNPPMRMSPSIKALQGRGQADVEQVPLAPTNPGLWLEPCLLMERQLEVRDVALGLGMSARIGQQPHHLRIKTQIKGWVILF